MDGAARPVARSPGRSVKQKPAGRETDQNFDACRTSTLGVVRQSQKRLCGGSEITFLRKF